MNDYSEPAKLIEKSINKGDSVTFKRPATGKRSTMVAKGCLAYVGEETMTYDTFIYLWYYRKN